VVTLSQFKCTLAEAFILESLFRSSSKDLFILDIINLAGLSNGDTVIENLKAVTAVLVVDDLDLHGSFSLNIESLSGSSRITLPAESSKVACQVNRSNLSSCKVNGANIGIF
jgi:hypothetical protein